MAKGTPEETSLISKIGFYLFIGAMVSPIIIMILLIALN